MDGIADERLARNDRAIQPQSIEPCRQISSVASAHGLCPHARTIEVDTAQLETVADLPDAVEGQPMSLIGLRERVFTAKIRCNGIRHLRESAERLWISGPQSGQRIRQRGLPVLVHALRDARLQTVVIGPSVKRIDAHNSPLRKRLMTD